MRRPSRPGERLRRRVSGAIDGERTACRAGIDRDLVEQIECEIGRVISILHHRGIGDRQTSDGFG